MITDFMLNEVIVWSPTVTYDSIGGEVIEWTNTGTYSCRIQRQSDERSNRLGRQNTFVSHRVYVGTVVFPLLFTVDGVTSFLAVIDKLLRFVFSLSLLF